MRRIRRVSIEVERQVITLYSASSSWFNPEDRNTSSAEPSLAVPATEMSAEELAAALKERRVHLHRNAEGHFTVCARKDCDE